MKVTLLLTLLVIAASRALIAQPSNVPAGAAGSTNAKPGNATNAANSNSHVIPGARTADDDWTNLSKLAVVTPVPQTNDSGLKSAAQIGADIKQAATAYQGAAQSARLFYTAHPNDSRVAAAHQIEVLSTLHAVDTSNMAQALSALTLADDYRNNHTYATADRFTVALASERLRLVLNIRGKRATDQLSEWSTIGDALKVEFGDSEALQDFYISVARRFTTSDAVTLAKNVTQAAVASPAAKSEALCIVDRATLLGSVIELTLTSTDGTQIDLSQLHGKTTVLVVWSPSDANALAQLKPVAKTFPSDAEVIYLAMASSPQQAVAARTIAPIPGTYCSVDAGAQGIAASNALKLGYAHVPYVYVLNSAGKVSGFGGIRNLPGLMTAVP